MLSRLKSFLILWGCHILAYEPDVCQGFGEKMAKTEKVRNVGNTLLTRYSGEPMYVWHLISFWACIKKFSELRRTPYRSMLCIGFEGVTHKRVEYVTDTFSASLRHVAFSSSLKHVAYATCTFRFPKAIDQSIVPLTYATHLQRACNVPVAYQKRILTFQMPEYDNSSADTMS